MALAPIELLVKFLKDTWMSKEHLIVSGPFTISRRN